jgi:hypothetical protein
MTDKRGIAEIAADVEGVEAYAVDMNRPRWWVRVWRWIWRQG